MSHLLTMDELCKWLKVRKRTVYEWTHKMKIPHCKLPNGDLRFEEAAINEWIKIRTVTPDMAGLENWK